MIYIKDFIYCFLATIFFAYVMSDYKKYIIVSGFVAAFGYVLYDYIMINYDNIFIAYLIATSFIGIIGELFSQILRIPSLVIVFPSVIALVPGIGLYKSILNLIEARYDIFIINLVQTIIIALEMAFIIAIANYIFKILKKLTKKSLKTKKI